MDNVWCELPFFDNFLLKFWTDEAFEQFTNLLRINELEIINALYPTKSYAECCEARILDKILTHMRMSNKCENFKFCQNVLKHSQTQSCYTAASVRQRLIDFPNVRGMLQDAQFQRQAMSNHSESMLKRQRLGVLLYHISPEESQNQESTSSSDADAGLSNHVIQSLHAFFYLYTVPNQESLMLTGVSRYERFVQKQIMRNTDVIVILVNLAMKRRWQKSDDCLTNAMLRTLGWALQVRIVLVSTCRNTDDIVESIYKSLCRLRQPWMISSQSMMQAPHGHLVTMVTRASRQSCGRSFSRIWMRAIDVCCCCRPLNDDQHDEGSLGIVEGETAVNVAANEEEPTNIPTNENTAGVILAIGDVEMQPLVDNGNQTINVV